MTITQLFSWVLANYQHLLLLVGAVIAAASLLIKSLEAIVALLVTLFPGLKTADGELLKAAAWLDALSKSKLLNGMALSPKGTAKALLLALGLVMLAPAPARAQSVLVSSGPTLPLVELRPGNPHPVSLAAGAGYQLSLTLPTFQRAFAGKAWDLLDVNLMAFGSAVSSSSGATFGALSAAVGLCTLSSLVCVGAGHDVVTAPGMPAGWFGLFALSLNVDLAPTAPPTGVATGAAGLERANTLHLGAL